MINNHCPTCRYEREKFYGNAIAAIFFGLLCSIPVTIVLMNLVHNYHVVRCENVVPPQKVGP